MSSRYDVIGPNTLEAMRRDAEITTMQDRIEQLKAALQQMERSLNVMRDMLIEDRNTEYPHTLDYARDAEACAEVARAALGEKKDD